MLLLLYLDVVVVVIVVVVVVVIIVVAVVVMCVAATKLHTNLKLPGLRLFSFSEVRRKFSPKFSERAPKTPEQFQRRDHLVQSFLNFNL
jgi:hypothetical protein